MFKSSLETRKERQPFQMFFLKNGEDLCVEVVESEAVDFEEVKERLERGESIFITRKQEPKTGTNFITNKGRN